MKLGTYHRHIYYFFSIYLYFLRSRISCNNTHIYEREKYMCNSFQLPTFILDGPHIIRYIIDKTVIEYNSLHTIFIDICLITTWEENYS